MSQGHHLCEYSLLILDAFLAKSTTLSELNAAIGSYPEDVAREGRVINDMQQFVASFPDFEGVAEEVKKMVAERGGREEMERYRDLMEFNEFMSG